MSTARTTLTVNKNESKNEGKNANENSNQNGDDPAVTVAESMPRTESPDRDHRLRWPEALAITVALLLGGAVAAGAFRPMLPWLG